MRRGALTIVACVAMSCTQETIIVQNITVVDTVANAKPRQVELALSEPRATSFGTVSVTWETRATGGLVWVGMRNTATGSLDAETERAAASGEWTVHHLASDTEYQIVAEVRQEGEVMTSESRGVRTRELPKCNVEQPSGPEAIDLGLSVLWADRNVGAASAEGAGVHVAWAEWTAKQAFTEEGWEVPDFVPDSIGGMEYYDICRRVLGEGWRLPSASEVRELREKCGWAFEVRDEETVVAKLTGPSGRSITLPCAGICDGYVTEHEEIDETYRSGCYMTGLRGTALRFYGNGEVYSHFVRKRQEMWKGMSVRAVRAK